LAGEGRIFHLAIDALGDVPRQRGLAGAGIAEQPEHRRHAISTGLGLHPVGNGLQRGILMRRKRGHGVQMESRAGGTPRLNGSVKLTIRAFHARLLPRHGIAVSWSRLDLGCMANTLIENNKRCWETQYEIRHLLRAPTATPMGRGRRAPALPERSDPTRDRRPARL